MRQSRIGDICEQVVDCPHSTPKWTEEGYVVLRNSNIRSGRLDLSSPSYTDSEHFKYRTKRAIPQAGDIVFTREAPMGEVCMIPEGVVCCLGQRQVLLRPSENIDGTYLLYALQSPEVQHQILWNEGTGSTVSNVRIPVLKSLLIPRISGELEVARILSTLDRKIDLNHHLNSLLEQTAQAIFHSWFVAFDPVRAKARALELGCDPERAAMGALSGKLRMPANVEELEEEDFRAAEERLEELSDEQREELAETAGLFPEGLVESEVGLVPEGWGVTPLGEQIEIIGGGTPKRSEESFWGGSIPWYSVKDAPDNGDLFTIQTQESITEEGHDGSSVRIVPSGTTIISARGTVGRLAIAGVPMTFNQSCYGIRGLEGYSDYYTYFNLRRMVQYLQRNVHGAVFDTITRSTFDSVAVSDPGPVLSEKFQDVVTPLMEQNKANSTQSVTLQDLRDTLLPRLISGELSIEGAGG